MNSKIEQLRLRAESFATKFGQGGRTNYIDKAIDLDRKALELCPVGHPKRSVSLTCLAGHLGSRYDQFGAMKDLEEAIVLEREALDLHPQGHRDRTMTLNNLAVNLSARYKQLGAIQDLDETIVLHREALDLCPEGHPNRPTSLNNLADNLATRYQQFGTMQDLEEAIVLDREALHLRPKGNPDRSISLNNLAARLATRYKQLGTMQDLEDAIVLDREALLLHPQGHHIRSISLFNVATNLFERYQQLGAMQDLDEAIVLHREALDLLPQGHPNRSMSLNSLASDLSARYNQLRIVQDLEEAIVLDREALSLCPQGHAFRQNSLNNLAIHLHTRYEHLRAMQDLDESIVLLREALRLCPEGHRNRSISLNNLANNLSDRYRELKTLEDLDEAISFNRESLHLRPQGHPLRSSSLTNLANHLSIRYQRLETMQDLDEAIVLGREVLQLCPRGHPSWSGSLSNLSGYLSCRFIRSKQLQDREELFSLCGQLACVPKVVSSFDLSAARAWIRAAEYFRHPTLLLAYETSLRYLVQHLSTLPPLPQHIVILKDHSSSLAVDAFAAYLRTCSPAKAVEFLEQGRGVFWSQLSRLRSPLDNVVASGTAGKVLANKFMRVSSIIRDALQSPGADQHDRVCRLNLEMQKVVTSIRELPGLSRFLLPSLFSELQQAASEGPVIIVNASKYGCDVLVVLFDHDPVHIPLQMSPSSVLQLSTELQMLTTLATRADVTRELASILRRLWDHIVSPVVDFLQTIIPPQSRIWWCPTAEFSTLPLHAAGPYREGQQNLADHYISSYTSTLTALIHARRRSPSNFATQKKRFVGIGQGKVTGENKLLSVGAELDGIHQCIDGLAIFTRIEGEESCISRVVEELGKNQWVHIACYSHPNETQPFESAFGLDDGHFTVQQIVECEWRNAEFAYLSTSHTTFGDEESPDEAIHLASAMQFAGFRSVIGTMWAVDDGETSKITSMFYKHMVDESGRLDHTRAAFALNKTMRSVDMPLDQRILYIHFGA